MSIDKLRWVAIISMGLTLLLHLVVSIGAHARFDRILRKQWTVLMRLETEATERRGGGPYVPTAPGGGR